MTFKYNNVYINATGTVSGPFENNGPIGKYFDKSYQDMYFKTTSWEKAETRSIIDSVDILLNKITKTKKDIDLFIAGDLLNQLVASNYAASSLGIPFLGVYNACATSVEGLIIGSNMIESNQIKNCIVSTSSHNNSSEKQFRYPVEYGGPKKKTATFTVTGAGSAYLSYNKEGVKIESATVGKVVDLGVKDVNNMGAVMAPAAAWVINKHLNDTKRKIDYYDLVLTGDLGIYGREILKDYMKTEYGITLKNYEDCGLIIFDRNTQPVYAGASGAGCVPLVTYGYIFNKLKKKELSRVLVVATGALFSQTVVNEKSTLPGIAHAISLEALDLE
ncbi:MAG TPA: stage V sporulation protein AD [Tenericutes bacterium]|nr:stage V sporulation protein AD [Mycoplasmatota bacterium]